MQVTNFRDDINGLRAYAVLMVVLYHFKIVGFSGGFIGVDIFFVISGFLMTQIICRKLALNNFSLLSFYDDRFCRIFPALFFVCVACFIMGYFFISPFEFERLVTHIVSSLLFFSNIVYAFEAGNYFDAGSKSKWLLHTWSLSVEWQFYLVYPILLSVVYRIFGSLRALFIFILAGFLISLSLSVFASPFPIKPKASFFLLPTRAWEMFAGGLVFFLQFRYKITEKKIIEILGFALILVAFFYFNEKTPWPSYYAILPVLGTSLVILSNQNNSPLTSNSVCQWFGSSSYSIYLYHWPLCVLLVVHDLFDDLVLRICFIVFSFSLGYLSYQVIEKNKKIFRISNLKKYSFFYQFRFLLPLAFFVCTLVLVKITNGALFRLKEEAVAYSQLVKVRDDWGHPDKFCSKVDNGSCFVKGNGSRLIAFIGDSHLEQIYPAVVNSIVSKDNSPSAQFLSQRGCLPIAGVTVNDNQNDCSSIMKSRWDFVFSNKVEHVIISAAWLIYFFDEDGVAKHRVCIGDINTDCSKTNSSENIKNVFNQLHDDISKLRSAGVRVTIIKPYPYTNFDFAKENSEAKSRKHLIYWGEMEFTEHDPAFSVDINAPFYKKVSDELERIAVSTGSAIVDPYSKLCVNNICSQVDKNGHPIYKDRGHFTKSFVLSNDFSWVSELTK